MKARILTPLLVEILDDERVRLVAPFVVLIDGERLEVPIGFVSDLASVPRIPFFYWLAGGKAKIPAVFHDWAYKVARKARAWCDQAFGALCELTKLASWRRSLMYAGVRAFGASHYGKAST